MKTIVITGTSRGIGKALANIFLKKGYKVIGTSTSGKTAIKNSNFEVIKLDLSHPTSIKVATRKIIKKTSIIQFFTHEF